MKQQWKVRRAVRALVGFGLLAVLVPEVADDYTLFLANLAIVYGIVSMGLTVVVGWTGQFAFISTAFVGLGAYAGGRLGALFDLPLEVVLVVGAVVGAGIAAVVGLRAVRLSGYYLSAVSIAFMYLLRYIYENVPTLTGGVRGFSVPTPYLAVLGGRELADLRAKYWVGLAILLFVYVTCSSLRRRALGRAWQVVRVNRDAATALAINPTRVAVLALVLAGAIFAIAGAWSAYVNGWVFPEQFGMEELLLHFLMIVLGGLGSLRGAVLGATIVVVLKEQLRGVIGLFEILFGGLLLASLLIFRRGFYGFVEERWPALREPFV